VPKLFYSAQETQSLTLVCTRLSPIF